MSDLSWLNSHIPCNRCVRFATTVASGHATLATKRMLLLTWAVLAPAGSHQLCLAHSFDHLVAGGVQGARPDGMAGLKSRRAPSENETEKERVSDDNHDRARRSGLSANLDLQREGHGDDRAWHQPGLGHAGLRHPQRGLLASNRATADSGSRVHCRGTIRVVRGETRQPLPRVHAG